MSVYTRFRISEPNKSMSVLLGASMTPLTKVCRFMLGSSMRNLTKVCRFMLGSGLLSLTKVCRFVKGVNYSPNKNLHTSMMCLTTINCLFLNIAFEWLMPRCPWQSQHFSSYSVVQCPAGTCRIRRRDELS